MTKQNHCAIKKAELISNNTIFIPKDLEIYHPLERSTAGPGVGSLTIAFSFENTVIKLAVSRDRNEKFSLHRKNDKFFIKKNGEEFLNPVSIIPIFFHSPHQIFLNLDDRCIYNCAFCNLKKKGLFHGYTKDRYVNLILKTQSRYHYQSLALTSGIYPDNTTIINIMSDIIEDIRKVHWTLPIGVEPCIFDKEEIVKLKKAGANEIKINLQIPDEKIFRKVCPDFDYDHIFNMLNLAVKIFGKNKVTSNILFGLGESDQDILQTTEALAKIGVVPTLRLIHTNQYNRNTLHQVLSHQLPKVTPERIMHLAREQKTIFQRYNLTTQTFNTMCHKCGCCDIVPFWDV